MYYYSTNCKKAIKLTIRTQNKYSREPDTVKIWETFNKVAFYWFKDRKDGPAWISETEKVWYDNGSPVTNM